MNKQLLVVLAMFAAVFCTAANDRVANSGIAGGLVVHVGCADPAKLMELHASDAFLVHGLDTDSTVVQQARTAIAGKKLYGKVSADTWDGKNLPYIDNLVNLLIADAGQVPAAEIQRVLVPYGVAMIGGKKVVKPWPANIDSWTHYLHDAGNNAVAHDTVIGPPRHVQWQGGPRWARHHDHVASLNAMVSERGRMFYIMDEGATASALTPSKWRLVARDAFNGIVLWKRDIPDWIPALWPLKSGPANLPRRLVAVGDTVYAPLGFTAPVTAMDATSGKTLRTYAGSDNTEEILVSGDILLALTITKQIVVAEPGPGQLAEAPTTQVRDRRITKSPLINYYWNTVQSPRWFSTPRIVKAYQASTGKLLWEAPASKVMPLSMAADAERVYFHDGEKIVALNKRNGTPAYQTEPVPVRAERMYAFFGPTLVIKDGVIVFAGGEKIGNAWMGWELKDQGQDTMTAFDAKTGRKMWTAPHPYGGYQSPEDVLVADGLVWAADTANGRAEGPWLGRDLQTGELKREIPPTVKTKWFHHRCYRAKATDRFMMPSRNGIEYIDILKKNWDINHWVRGGCLYGIMPANGFTYSTPHDCACHPQAKLCGFNALAAESDGKLPPVANRLQKGPAYGKISCKPAAATDWPMYRNNERRSGSISTSIGKGLAKKWSLQLGSGKLTQAVVSGGLLVTACPDAHTVFALDAATGKPRWRHIAGGRVDSSPTICGDMVVFGSSDGCVSCLRASDGALAWRFRAAPSDRRMMSFGQVESVWPVNGSVLVKDGEVFFTAGRSFFLDGGVHFYRLDVQTGKVVSQTLFDKFDYKTGEEEIQAKGGLDMPVGLPDILSANGDTLYMRSQLMDRDGKRTEDKQDHLFAPYGFVDDDWFHRAYWVFGKAYMGGCGGYTKAGKIFPSGRQVVFDADNVYVFGRNPGYFRWITEMDYRLFCSSRKPVEKEPVKDDGAKKKKKKKKKSASSSINLQWEHEIPLLVRAMCKAGDELFIAGPPDFVNEAETVKAFPAPDAKAVLKKQDGAYRGEAGGILCVVSTKGGETINEYPLADLPVLDGISIANGNLYMVTETGKVICMQGK